MHPSAARLYAAAKAVNPSLEGQSAVGRAIGQTPQTVKNWESRGVSAQGASAAQRKLGISATWILAGDPPMFTTHAPDPQSHPLQLQVRIISDTVRLVDYIDERALEPITDRSRLVRVAAAVVASTYERGIDSSDQLEEAGREVVKRYRAGEGG